MSRRPASRPSIPLLIFPLVAAEDCNATLVDGAGMGKYAYGNERWAPECSHMQRMLAVIRLASCMRDCSMCSRRIALLWHTHPCCRATKLMPCSLSSPQITSHRFSASSLIHADSMQSLTGLPGLTVSLCRALRLEDAAGKDAPKVLRDFDGRLAGAVEALQRSGRWRQVLDAGGSSQEQLGRPSPAVQVRQWLC